ncbi:MAG: hypothetical protein FWD31_14760 [Planctomycetaceae bacterium]|nr:hypothetical protein [Planctomycetaceae bacterium]
MSTVFVDKVEIAQSYGGELENNQGSRSIDRKYTIVGTIDEMTAYARFAEYIYTQFPTVSGLRVETLGVEGNREGAPLYTGNVRWSSKANESEMSLPVKSFSTKGGTTKKTWSFETVDVVSLPGFTATDFQRGIGFKDGSYEGCDVITPNYTANFERKGLPAWFVTDAYEKLLFMMTGSINGSPFDGKAPGELMFMGAEGKQNITNENGQIKITWDMTWEFKASPNIGGIIVSPGFPPIDKHGWDYLWLYRETVDNEESGRSIPLPRAAYVERVYLYSNFMALGIF